MSEHAEPVKLSDVIEELEWLRKRHGDVAVLRVNHQGHMIPMLKSRLVMTTRGSNEVVLLIE